MKRGGRIKARVNPRKAEGDKLRRRYFDAHVSGLCELAYWVNVTFDNDGCHTVFPGHEPLAATVHEIFSPGGTRPLVWSNFIALNAKTHDRDHFGTRGEPVNARLLCVLSKIRKRIFLGRPDEFYTPEADRMCGKGGGILGWAEGLPRFEEPHMEAYREEVVRKLEEFYEEDYR